jgi:hypothetical protein
MQRNTKKILQKVTIIALFLFQLYGTAHGAWWGSDTPSQAQVEYFVDDSRWVETAKKETNKETNTVYVTEKVPWGNCTCGSLVQWTFIPDDNKCWTITTRLYQCTVTPGMDSFKRLIAQFVWYFVRIVLLLAVLAIVGLGIAWAWAGWDDAKAKTKLKGWAMNIAVGLAILFFFQYILKFLAPWIFQ